LKIDRRAKYLKARVSLVHIDVHAQVSFTLDVCLVIGHLEVIVDEVNDKVREPGVLPLRFEQPAEETQAFLAEVISKHFEGHQRLVLVQTLSKESETEILNVIVGHVQVDEGAVNRKGLSDRLCTIISALVVCQLKRLKGAVFSLQVLSNGLAAFEGDLIGVEVQNTKSIVFKQMFHHDIDTIVSEHVFLK